MKMTWKFSIEECEGGFQIVTEQPDGNTGKSRVFPNLEESFTTLGKALDGLLKLDGVTVATKEG